MFHYSPTPPRMFRSADQNLLRVPGPKEIKLASTRARWNALTGEMRALRELNQFRSACKTERFRQAYG